MSVTGRVVEEQKNYFVVDLPEAGRATATCCGLLKKSKFRVCAGDIVEVNIIDKAPLRGIITGVHERSTFIKRPALANCSHLLCVFTYKEPPLNLEALDRLLFNAHIQKVEPCIVFNKTDLLSTEDNASLSAISDVYRSAGYEVFLTSCVDRGGIDAIVDFCAGRITACAGPSGSGKSTLLSLVFPDVNFRIGSLSASASRGTHTTTNVRLLKLDRGGYIADTPGLSLVETPAVPPQDVALYFPELAACIGTCRYNDCIHDKEPGCTVADKVDKGEIARWRRDHYLKIYREMAEKRRREQRGSS